MSSDKPFQKEGCEGFTLQNMTRVYFSSLGQLKAEIVKQLGSSTVYEDCDFDVGYIKGQAKVFSTRKRICLKFGTVWSKVSLVSSGVMDCLPMPCTNIPRFTQVLTYKIH